MKEKISYFLDAIDNPRASKVVRVMSGIFWSCVLAGFFFSCLFFAYVFQW